MAEVEYQTVAAAEDYEDEIRRLERKLAELERRTSAKMPTRDEEAQIRLELQEQYVKERVSKAAQRRAEARKQLEKVK